MRMTAMALFLIRGGELGYRLLFLGPERSSNTLEMRVWILGSIDPFTRNFVHCGKYSYSNILLYQTACWLLPYRMDLWLRISFQSSTKSSLYITQIHITPWIQIFVSFNAVFLPQMVPLFVPKKSLCSPNLLVKFQQAGLGLRFSVNRGQP